MKSIICEIIMESGTVYKIRSFLKNAKLIEFNENIQGESGVPTLVKKPESDGFLAIFMLKTIDHEA